MCLRKSAGAGGRHGAQQSEIENIQSGVHYRGKTVLCFEGEMSPLAHVFEHLGKAGGAGAQVVSFSRCRASLEEVSESQGWALRLGLTSCLLSPACVCDVTICFTPLLSWIPLI